MLTCTVLPSRFFLNCSDSVLITLRELRLGQNELTGAIPNTIGLLEGLQILSLSENGFTASPLPPEIALLPNLSVLDLSAAAFTGSFPSEYTLFPALTELNLAGNMLAGPLPMSGWDGLGSLTSLDLSANQFSGSIPGAIAGAFNLGKDCTANAPPRVVQIIQMQILTQIVLFTCRY